MKLHLLPGVGVVAAAALALGITFTTPAALPGTTSVTPPRGERIACQPVVAGKLLARAADGLAVGAFGEDAADAESPTSTDTDGLTLVSGIAPSGGIVAGDQFAPCQGPATNGYVLFPDSKVAELRLTNADAGTATVDLTLLGPAGEVEALGARGISLAPGETRPIAVSVLAKGIDGPVAVSWKTSEGRAVAAGVTVGDAKHVVASTSAKEQHLLPGQAEGGKPVVLLANPGLDRVGATIQFHSTASTFTPEGGDGISIPARSVVMVDLSAGTAGDPGAFTVEADAPVVATLISGAGDQRGSSGATEADTSLVGVVPGGSTVQLTNVGDEAATATLTLGGESTDVTITAGTTATAAVPAGDVVEVQADSDQPLLGAAVTAEGKGVVALSSASVAEAEPLDAELVPALR